MHSHSRRTTDVRHYGPTAWTTNSTGIILHLALVSCVCVLASDKVVKCPVKQYKWQYSSDGQAPSMASNLSPRGITPSPLSLGHGGRQVKPGPFFWKLISSAGPSTSLLLCFRNANILIMKVVGNLHGLDKRHRNSTMQINPLTQQRGAGCFSRSRGACLHWALISCCCHAQCHSYQPLEFAQSSHPLACFCSVFLPDTAGQP